ncbi:MAG: hypothetical protein QMC98_01665 [Candidatus Thermoplasmatota archaeon]|nr:hypothetical protein [Candidatus Thermoplasmatota archaeon]
MANATIAVKKSTLQILKDLKEEEGASSIDELISRLVRLRKRVPSSLKGAYPKLKPLTEKEEEEVFDV